MFWSFVAADAVRGIRSVKKRVKKKKKSRIQETQSVIEEQNSSENQSSSRHASLLDAAAEVAKARKRKVLPDFEELRELRSKITTLPLDQQFEWVKKSFESHAEDAKLGVFEDAELSKVSPMKSMIATLPPAVDNMNLEEGLKAIDPKWKSVTCSLEERLPGQPSVLMLSSSAMGCVHMIRRGFPRSNSLCRIGKLFAKHFKVEEQEKLLKTQTMCIAAGTPNRCLKLMDSGALSLERLRWVVLDVTVDVKGRTILDQPQVAEDWWKFYLRTKDKFHVDTSARNGARIVLYARRQV